MIATLKFTEGVGCISSGTHLFLTDMVMVKVVLGCTLLHGVLSHSKRQSVVLVHSPHAVMFVTTDISTFWW